MSSDPSQKPPLVCRSIRLRASLTEGESATVISHCATCPGCREYFDTSTTLESALRRDAGQSRVLAPATLEHRVLNAVRHSTQETHRPALPSSWRLAGLMTAAAAVVLLVRLQNPPTVTTPAATVQDVIAVANQLPQQWLTTLQPGAARLLEDNPLQAEMASVQSDTRSALDFLAMNFLPVGDKRLSGEKSISPPRRSS